MNTNEETVAFIESLELADSRHVNFPEITALTALDASKDSAGKESGFVDAGSLVSFVSGVSEQSQADVLNSTLLAQLAANKKYDREQEAREWYKFYINVLENIGWVLQGFTFTKYQGAGGSLTCEKAVIDILSAVATGDQQAVVAATIDALKNLSSRDNRVVLFERESHNLHQGNFQISSAQESGGVVSMATAAMELNSNEKITKVLFFSWETATTDLYYGSQMINLNLDVYDQIRGDIVKKLGDKAKKFIADLEI